MRDIAMDFLVGAVLATLVMVVIALCRKLTIRWILRPPVWLILALAAVALMAFGLGRGEWTVVKRHATTLCTGCIGLTSDVH